MRTCFWWLVVVDLIFFAGIEEDFWEEANCLDVGTEIETKTSIGLVLTFTSAFDLFYYQDISMWYNSTYYSVKDCNNSN